MAAPLKQLKTHYYPFVHIVHLFCIAVLSMTMANQQTAVLFRTVLRQEGRGLYPEAWPISF
jgi:hypothetical protein